MALVCMYTRTAIKVVEYIRLYNIHTWIRYIKGNTTYTYTHIHKHKHIRKYCTNIYSVADPDRDPGSGAFLTPVSGILKWLKSHILL
jgi:hypothetical protein